MFVSPRRFPSFSKNGVCSKLPKHDSPTHLAKTRRSMEGKGADPGAAETCQQIPQCPRAGGIVHLCPSPAKTRFQAPHGKPYPDHKSTASSPSRPSGSLAHCLSNTKGPGGRREGLEEKPTLFTATPALLGAPVGLWDQGREAGPQAGTRRSDPLLFLPSLLALQDPQ